MADVSSLISGALSKPLAAERLRELLHYDPDTGVFTWRINRGLRRIKGNAAGHLHYLGYRTIRIDGQMYPASHLAWLYMKGEWPPADRQIDHENRKRADNRWANIRLATPGQNQANAIRVIRKLPRGVYPHGPNFRAQLRKAGKLFNLGTFRKLEDAAEAYRRAAVIHHGEFSVLNFSPPDTGG